MSDPMDSLTGLMAVVLSLLMPVVMLLILLKYRSRSEERRHALYLEAIRQGKSMDLVLQMGSQRLWATYRTGMVLAMLGLGLLAAGLVESDRDWMAAAFLPLCIGLGFLISFRYQRRAGHGSLRAGQGVGAGDA